MNIDTIKVGFLGTNCYLVSDSSGECAIVDPGDSADKILNVIEEKGYNVRYILLTHGHFDHIGAVDEVAKKTGAKIAIHGNDAALLTGSESQRFSHGVSISPSLPTTYISSGQEITVGELCFKIMHTPGHTPGGVIYFCGDAMFTGDTLFKDFVGRTDLAGGDTKKMKESLAKINEITEDYRVFPGHDSATTLGTEQKTNPYLRSFDYDIYD